MKSYRYLFFCRREAVAEAKDVAEIVNHWRVHFAAAGVDRNTIDILVTQIDRSQLLEQRRALDR